MTASLSLYRPAYEASSAVSSRPLACVVGDVDLVRTLGLAGVKCAVVVEPGAPARYSRAAVRVLDKIDPASHPELAVQQLLDLGHTQKEKPVLYYDGDWDLLLVSRYRQRLREVFRFVVPDAELVEDLVDKARYQEFARRLDIPVPAARRLIGTDQLPESLGLDFPLVAKPLTRHHGTWRAFSQTKARHIEDQQDLFRFYEEFSGSGLEVLMQEVVPGPEDRVVSYHAYVDSSGEIVGEFTDRKLRTYPRTYGYSTAIEITDTADVRDLGRELTRRMKLRPGVAKFDFKRDPNGELILLEVNPRFNLVHHPGALAGVNLPALVYHDLVGLPRPAQGLLRPGVTWCNPAHDFQASRLWGISFPRWLWSFASSKAKSGFAWDDPWPLVRAVLWRVGQRIRLLAGRSNSADAIESQRGDSRVGENEHS